MPTFSIACILAGARPLDDNSSVWYTTQPPFSASDGGRPHRGPSAPHPTALSASDPRLHENGQVRMISAAVPTLLVRTHDGHEFRFSRPFHVGRSADCDIQIEDPHVSRVHLL